MDERIACRVTSHYKGCVSLALADQILSDVVTRVFADFTV